MVDTISGYFLCLLAHIVLICTLFFNQVRECFGEKWLGRGSPPNASIAFLTFRDYSNRQDRAMVDVEVALLAAYQSDTSSRQSGAGFINESITRFIFDHSCAVSFLVLVKLPSKASDLVICY